MPYRSHHSQPIPAHVPDFGPIGDTLPVPTVTTPINAPSPSHDRPSPPSSPSPPPLPVPESNRSRERTPIPDYSTHSPSHPPVDMLPDGYIPYARDNDTHSIVLPPPHELERPLSEMEPSPPRSEVQIPAITTDEIRAAPPPGIIYGRHQNTAPSYEPSVRSRDYAYNGGPSGLQPANVLNSPQSRTSTNISQYEMVKPPRYDRNYVREVERERAPPQVYYDPVSRMPLFVWSHLTLT